MLRYKNIPHFHELQYCWTEVLLPKPKTRVEIHEGIGREVHQI